MVQKFDHLVVSTPTHRSTNASEIKSPRRTYQSFIDISTSDRKVVGSLLKRSGNAALLRTLSSQSPITLHISHPVDPRRDLKKHARELRVKQDDEGIFVYAILPTSVARRMVKRQNISPVVDTSDRPRLWLYTSLPQALYMMHTTRKSFTRHCVVSIKIGCCAFEDMLMPAALIQERDAVSSGLYDPRAAVQVLWERSRGAWGQLIADEQSMRIGVGGQPLTDLCADDVEIVDVTDTAQRLWAAWRSEDQVTAEQELESFQVESAPLENEDIEWRLGMY